MKKFVCTICGYVHEGDAAPDACPQCKAPASKFTEHLYFSPVAGALYSITVGRMIAFATPWGVS